MALQKSNNNKRRHRRMRHKPMSRDDPNPSVCAHCGANIWCNQRVVKLVMTLKCCACGENKKLNKNNVWYDWKCVEFHKTSECSLGDDCKKMHIYYSKTLAMEKSSLGSLPCGSDSQSNSCFYESTAYDTASCVSGYHNMDLTERDLSVSVSPSASPTPCDDGSTSESQTYFTRCPYSSTSVTQVVLPDSSNDDDDPGYSDALSDDELNMLLIAVN